MAFQKKTWLARLGQGLNKFIFNGGSKVTLDSSPDVVTQEGTPLSADNMNDLEDRIDDEFTNVNSAITALGATVNTITTETITLANTYFYSADYAHYVVKNGICEVSIDFRARNNISSYTSLCTLPKPKVSFYLEVPTNSSYSEPIITVNSDGQVLVNNCSSGKTYFTHFCYIVDDAE